MPSADLQRSQERVTRQSRASHISPQCSERYSRWKAQILITISAAGRTCIRLFHHILELLLLTVRRLKPAENTHVPQLILADVPVCIEPSRTLRSGSSLVARVDVVPPPVRL